VLSSTSRVLCVQPRDMQSRRDSGAGQSPGRRAAHLQGRMAPAEPLA